MNVLSLFDGMSCGQIALNNLGIKVDNYFASEIDKYAVKVSKKNYPNTKHVGDVTKVYSEDLPQIDLLIGGSPCQSFSSVGGGEGFDGSSGLFFEWVRLLRECKPKYFLLENVTMKKEWEQIITDEVGVEPVLINSKHFTGQNRKRLYWTNIPIAEIDDRKVDGIFKGNEYWSEIQPTPFVLKKHSMMEEVSEFTNPYNKSNLTDTFPNLTAQGNSQTKSSSVIRIKDDEYFMANLQYWSELQGVDKKYFDGFTESQGKKMLGNGWTVPVIEHIFSGLKTI